MAKKKTPTQSYEDAFAMMTYKELAEWVWAIRVRNTLMKARQRSKKAREWNASLKKDDKRKPRSVQTRAIITLIDRRGSRLLPKDNHVRNLVAERMIKARLRFTSALVWKGDKVKVRVVVDPISRVRYAA